MTTYKDPSGTKQSVVRHDDYAMVIMGEGYRRAGEASVVLENTGNGYIARFPASNCTQQDYFVCLDYGQAYDLVLALSAFKKELGFE